MVKDYSGSCITINGRYKKIPHKTKTTTKSRSFFSATRLMWKTLGTMLFVTVIIGISSTIWYGWQVQLALDQIGNYQVTNSELTRNNRLLIVQRDLIQGQDHMEKAAQKIGLYSPTKSQLRYP
ncbi:hypothetical protein ACFLZQ_08100 [Thermodesulfobacteriota bacterium]